MGQVTSTDRAFRSPVSVSQGLKLRELSISNSKSSDIKRIKIDDQNGLHLPKSPISTFTQNTTSKETLFLMDLDIHDVLSFSLRLCEEVVNDFNQMGKDSFTIFNDLKVSFLDNEKKLMSKHVLAKRIEIHKDSKSEKDAKVIGIDASKNLFNIKIDLSMLNRMGKVYMVVYGNSAESIIEAPLYLRDREKKITIDETSQSIRVDDPQFEFLSDGPEFRKNISTIETNLMNFKPLIKTLIKKSQALEESSRNLAVIRSSFCSSLSDLISYSTLVDSLILREIVHDLIPLLTAKSTNDIDDSNMITQKIITPLTMIYNSDIKLLATNKKIYNDQAKEFYTWTTKYMTNNANDANSQDQHLKQRLKFETNRLDYFNYLNEFRNGYLIRSLLYSLALYLQKSSPPASMTQETKHDIAKAKFYYQNFDSYRKEQLKEHARLENVENFQQLADIFTTENSRTILNSEDEPSTPQNSTSHKKNSIDRPKPIAKDSIPLLVKEGILYTLGGQSKHGWHKQYIVLQNNLLSEYTDWREGNNLRTEPIDITFSCVRKVDFKDRDFCFEVITPSNIKRVFQAENDVERDAWLEALNVALAIKAQNNQFNKISRSSSLQRSASLLLPTGRKSKDDSDLSRSSASKISKRNSQLRSSSYMGSSSGMSNENVSSDKPFAPSSALSIAREAEASNKICCDCGSDKNVEWISINLLVIMCIECSGAHRSLGTHISKVRSLTLDNKAFSTRESQYLLQKVSNKFANSYWEGSLGSTDKLKPNSTPDQRKVFITNKYLNKRFLPKPDFKPNDILIKGIHSADTHLVLKALAYGANTDIVVVRRRKEGGNLDITIFEYSLSHYHGTTSDPIFDLSQLLLLNNAACGSTINPEIELNEKQKDYWLSRIPVYGTYKSQNRPVTKEQENKAITSFRKKTGDKEKQVKRKDKTNRTSLLRLPRFRSD